MSWQGVRIRIAKILDAYCGPFLLMLQGAWMVHERRTQPRPIRKILFIKLWGMGSIVLSQPVLRRLREVYPDAEIHYLTLEQNRDLFSLIPAVDKVHSLPFGSLVRFLVKSLLLVRRLRQENYDLIFDAEFFVNFSLLMACLARGRRIVGFGQAQRIKNRFFHDVVPFLGHLHTAQQFMRLVEEGKLSPEKPPQPELSLPLKGHSLGLLSNGGRPYVVLNVNASLLAWERRWPRERFVELGRALLKAYSFDLILTGSGSERDYVASTANQLSFPSRVHNYAGCLTLVQLAHLIGGSLLVISNDSGPIHLAAALRVPVVGFYGPETPLRYGPLTSPKLVFYEKLWCSPCMSVDNAKTVNCINNLACMKQIDTGRVLPQLFDFIDREILPSEDHDCRPEDSEDQTRAAAYC